jgi:hypothetical protein
MTKGLSKDRYIRSLFSLTFSAWKHARSQDREHGDHAKKIRKHGGKAVCGLALIRNAEVSPMPNPKHVSEQHSAKLKSSRSGKLEQYSRRC